MLSRIGSAFSSAGVLLLAGLTKHHWFSTRLTCVAVRVRGAELSVYDSVVCTAVLWRESLLVQTLSWEMAFMPAPQAWGLRCLLWKPGWTGGCEPALAEKLFLSCCWHPVCACDSVNIVHIMAIVCVACEHWLYSSCPRAGRIC